MGMRWSTPLQQPLSKPGAVVLVSVNSVGQAKSHASVNSDRREGPGEQVMRVVASAAWL